MPRSLLLIAFCLAVFYSCKKDSVANHLPGQWVWLIQYANNPAFNSTPQSTGNHEQLNFTQNGHYSLTQNGTVTNSGTYKTSMAQNNRGEKVSSVSYTNERVRDSIAYYSFTSNNDSLFFSYDLIGTLGSGARYYGRQ